MAMRLSALSRMPVIVAAAAVAGCTSQAVKPAPVAQAPAPIAQAAPEPVRITFDTIYFSYNSAHLRKTARAKLEKAADLLLAHPDLKVEVAGNCDERGTDAYNVALGWKRAYAVRDALHRLGISEDRLFPISYGRSRPAVTGDTEAAWSKNRRDEVTPRS